MSVYSERRIIERSDCGYIECETTYKREQLPCGRRILVPIKKIYRVYVRGKLIHSTRDLALARKALISQSSSGDGGR